MSFLGFQQDLSRYGVTNTVPQAYGQYEGSQKYIDPATSEACTDRAGYAHPVGAHDSTYGTQCENVVPSSRDQLDAHQAHLFLNQDLAAYGSLRHRLDRNVQAIPQQF